MKTIRVNPAEVNGKPLVVLRENGTVIKKTKEGTKVPKTSFYGRLIKDGDLINLDAVKEQAPVAKEEKKKGGK